MATRKTPHYTNDRLEEIQEYGISVETREIFLDGLNEEEDHGVNHVMANRAIKNIQFLSNLSDEAIILHHYNIGGICEAGFAIYDVLKQCKCHITIICHGICASMGTVITQAGDIRLCMPNCTFLLHEGSLSSEGNYRKVEAFVLHDKRLMSEIMNIYMEKMKNAEVFHDYSPSRVKKFIKNKFDQKQEWFLTALDAHKYGLVDDIIGITKYNNLSEAACIKN